MNAEPVFAFLAAKALAATVVAPLFYGVIVPIVMGFLYRRMGGFPAFVAHQEERAAIRRAMRAAPWPQRLRFFWGQRLPELVLVAAAPVALVFGPFVVYGLIARSLGWIQ